MKSYVVYRRELFLNVLVLLGIGTGLLFWSLMESGTSGRTFWFGGLLGLIVLITPFLTIAFTREAWVEFGDLAFAVHVRRRNGTVPTTEFHLRQLRSYSILYPGRRFTVLRLRLRSGKAFEYAFLNQLRSEDQVETTALMNQVRAAVQQYNEAAGPKEQVRLTPSFLASKVGLIVTLGIFLAFVAGGWLLRTYDPMTAPIAWLIGFFFTVQLFLRRRLDLEAFRKMR